MEDKKQELPKKYYYVVFKEFIRQSTTLIPTKEGGKNLVNDTSMIMDKHPFIWKYEAMLGKDPTKYFIHITWWKEITKDEFALAIRLQQLMNNKGSIDN